MTSLSRLIVVAAAAVVAVGCISDFDQDVDCSDDCNDDDKICGQAPDRDFDYNGYDADCSAADDTPELCGVSEADDCVEPDFELEEATVADVHSALQAGDISCEWLTSRYIDRILWHDLYMDDGDPPLNAFVHLNDRAVETARTLDDYQRCEGELAGPLHCVPFGIKSNYGSTEVPVTNGSLALMDPQPDFDAFSVERLRAAGAINIGATAMDEFAAGAQGLSGRSGKTGNAYDTHYSSGGSSAGSGVAAAANMAMGALGTDNCSSLTIPAAYNNLFTIRSSHQLISTDGIFPTNRLDAVAGPMTRSAEDMIRMFDEMATFNPDYKAHCDDEIGHDGMAHDVDFTDALDETALEGKTIGVLEQIGDDPDDERKPFGAASAEVDDHFDDFFDELTDAGAQLQYGIELDELSTDRSGTGSGYDANQFLADSTGGAGDYDELCETDMYGRSVFADRDECLDRGDQSARRLRSLLESGLETYRDNRDYVEQVMDDHDLDALVYPADRNGPPRAAYTRTMCVLSSVTGLPTVIVPTGFTEDGLPIGMSLTARMFDDKQLLAMAYSYDRATDHRHPPDLPDLEGQPPVDIDDFEEIHYEMGLAAFEEVLGETEDKYDLDADLFAELTEEILRDWDLEVYIDDE